MNLFVRKKLEPSILCQREVFLIETHAHLQFGTRLLPKTNMAEHAVPASFYANDVVFSLGKDWLIKEVSVINILSASLKTIASL